MRTGQDTTLYTDIFCPNTQVPDSHHRTTLKRKYPSEHLWCESDIGGPVIAMEKPATACLWQVYSDESGRENEMILGCAVSTVGAWVTTKP